MASGTSSSTLRRARVRRGLLLLLALLVARLGGAEAYCTCPSGQATCGVGDLQLVAAESDTIAATSCVPDASGHVEADIWIQANDALTALDLSGLSSVGGYLSVDISAVLTALDLSALSSVGGDLFVGNRTPGVGATWNRVLTALDLSALSSVGGRLDVVWIRPALTTLDLSALSSVGGYLYVVGNSLTTLDLSALSSVHGVGVQDNYALTALDLSALSSIGGDLDVDNNGALTALDLSSLSSVGGYQLYVANNGALTVLDMRQLAQVDGSFTVANNNDAITTTLPCAAKAIAKLNPAGDIVYWNAHPTVCHAGTTTVGNDSTCGECVEYSASGGGACGAAAGACVRCNTTGAPVARPGFVKFEMDQVSQQTSSQLASQVYPCVGASCDDACRCPFDTTTCDFATDLVNTQGLDGQQECMPTAADSLGANVYVYGNPTIETITLSGIVSVGSLVVVNCPNLRTVSAPDTIAAGNVTVQSCDSLESMSAPLLSSTGFFEVNMCPALTSLEVANISTIGGALTITECESLPGISFRVLEAVGGSVAISNAAQVQSIELNMLRSASAVVISGVGGNSRTVLPCSAKQQPWESQIAGTVRYSSGATVVCHDRMSTFGGEFDDICSECGVCADCSMDGAPQILERFVSFRVPGNEGVHLNAYPCHAGECSSHTVCRCPFDTTTCDFATDLVNAQGLAGQQECMPTAADSLGANVYVYGNPTIETITLSGIVSVGSLVVVNCPNLRTVSAPDTIAAGNVTVQSCDSLESMSAPLLSSTGFFEVNMCPALTSLEVANISAIGGALTITECESLPGISFRVLEAVGGSVAISNAAQVQSIELNVLHAVSGSFSTAGVHSDAVTTLPCAARSKPWESASVGTVEYSTGVPIACQSASSTHTSEPTTSCDVCDICVSCDNDDEGTPVLLPGFVQFIGEATTMEATHVFECDSKLGCHTATSTSSSNCISDRYEGHFCMSCASGFEHGKADGLYEYECIECDTADLAISVLALAICAVVIGAIGTWAWKKQ
eukprot:COSAG06_NODE_5175_length_3660_cov_22.158944_1_plen_1019_part_01